MNQTEPTLSASSTPDAQGAPARRFAFVQAGWHADVVARGREGFLAELARLAPQARVDILDAPGAFETPLIAQKLARESVYDAIVVCAFIVGGAIYRHDFVARAVVEGLMRVGLDSGVPVLSVALTPHQPFHEQAAHAAFFREHFLVEGAEAAQAALAACAPARRAAA